MIKVKRLDCPDILRVGIEPVSEGENETNDTIRFYKNALNHKLKYHKTGKKGTLIKESYVVYSDKSVRKLLVKMCNGKCAYCESKIISIYSGDIEHFRPKGGYHNYNGEDLVKPGYYWLASDWENLLFACPFCNQTNTQEISDEGEIKEVVLGKLNQFPLKTETYRLNHTHGAIFFSDKPSYQIAFDKEESERLLLKPCSDEIEKHFKYSDDGLILANDGLNANEERKANESIRVYALQRLALVQTRAEKIIQIKAQLKRVEQAITNYSRHYNDSYEERVWFEGILRDEMIILKRFMDDDQEYAGLARYLIENYFNQLSE